MGDLQEVEDLERRIALDRQKYDEIERLRDELMENPDHRGFGAISAELRYRGEMEALEHSIRVGEEMLAGAKAN